MSEKFVALQVRMQKALEGGREAGQGVLEYVGMIVVASIVIVAVFGAIKGTNIDQHVTTAINNVLNLK